MTSKEKKELKMHLCYLADNEFKKYEWCLNHCKDAFLNNDVKLLGHWLNVASMSLRQSATYRVKSLNLKGVCQDEC